MSNNINSNHDIKEDFGKKRTVNENGSNASGAVTLGLAVREGAVLLKAHQVDNAEYDSFAIMAGINGMDRTYYYLHTDEQVVGQDYSLFLQRIAMRASHIPLQHILGKAYFYGYEFRVDKNVLVPRPDTEVQVVADNSIVLDMCTGSGCIVLTLALERHLKAGIGMDISEKALAVAQENCNLLRAENVRFVQSNLFAELDKTADLGKNFDIIISNPPYIRTDVIATLSEEVKFHDPMIALDGYEDGLYFYREITKSSVKYLKTGGWLMYEIGYDQAADVSDMMRTAGFRDVSAVKDYSGLDRVVKGRL
jgi:release factor glutamine methyltransferase